MLVGELVTQRFYIFYIDAFEQEEQLEYHRYLKEVVQALESDPDFKAQLEKADEDDIRVM